LADLVDEVRGALPRIGQYRDAVKGDGDLELVVERIGQVERLLESLAIVRSATDEAHRAAARDAVEHSRAQVKGPLP
jgi:hypothetical protein